MKILSYFDLPLELSRQDREDLLAFQTKQKQYYLQHQYSNGNLGGINLDTNLKFLINTNVAFQHFPSAQHVLKQCPPGSFETPSVIDKVLNLFNYKPWTWSFTNIEPNKKVNTHIDGIQEAGSRKTVVIFPLEPYNNDYAPCEIMGYRYKKSRPIEKIRFRPCYVFSTERWHRVYNNKYNRTSLQLWYNEPIEWLHDIHKENKLIGIRS